MDNNEILTELINKQLKNIDSKKKLQYSDLKRICKYIDNSIFDENKCCIWKGYITNSNNNNKGTYISFYFREKKIILHRLLYSNFVEQLNSDEYLKFNCENIGKCCNIKHLKKFKYNNIIKKKENVNNKTKQKNNIKVIKINDPTNCDPNRLKLSFD